MVFSSREVRYQSEIGSGALLRSAGGKILLMNPVQRVEKSRMVRTMRAADGHLAALPYSQPGAETHLIYLGRRLPRW